MFFVSKDQGKHWKDIGARIDTKPEYASGKHVTKNMLQPTVIERKDGSLFSLSRVSRPLGKMYQSISTDEGKHWTKGEPSFLPNPGGGCCMMRLQSGNVGIVYNHSPAAPLNSFERNPVSFAISEDEGQTFQYRRNLCEFHPDDPEHPEKARQSFGYPTMTQGADGTIHVTWSFSHPEMMEGNLTWFTDIQYTNFTEDWVKEHAYFEDAFEL
jgi:predicted neuraminidase